MDELTTPILPRRIAGLEELANNLWWSWNTPARNMFKSLDRTLWKLTGHNPVKLLQKIEPYRLVAAAEEQAFVQNYDDIMSMYEKTKMVAETWFNKEYPHLAQRPIAYFSLEFAIHNSLPIYAGGLGVLAGDYCKEASDLGIPLIGIGFMYPQGYVHQHINEDGWQEDIYEQLDFNAAPIELAQDNNGKPLKIEIPLDDKKISVIIWETNVGRVRLFLMDTHVEENEQVDRELSARLYVGDREIRLAQEILLGIGGVRVLRALGLQPSVWHANEGHTAFMILERVRELVESGLSFNEAADHVRKSTIFTTHTPIPAGHDVFSLDLIEKYFHRYWVTLGLDRDAFMNLGKQEQGSNLFNMTVLALRLANHRNGVSEVHGSVCRKMWHSLWPELPEREVPISSVTNGVHVRTWLGVQMADIYTKYLGSDWSDRHDDPELWKCINDVPDEELWAARRWLKYKLISEVQNRARTCWATNHVSPGQALAMGGFLDTETLTIGFSRRFTAYKRASLILHDQNRLKHILRNEYNPVQIIFAGKAHPDDQFGKQLIQEVFNAAKNPDFGGRISFVEDYDMHVARYLVQGADVWLNLPRPLREASGTSGQKAAINGVLNLSVLDGWWYEGYNGSNGWEIHNYTGAPDSQEQDRADAESLYELLEEKVIPLYYDRDDNGIPHGWVKMIKESIRSNAPDFSARRMAKDYLTHMYLPAYESSDIANSGTDIYKGRPQESKEL